MKTGEPVVCLRGPRESDLGDILRIERAAFGPDAFNRRQFRYLFFRAKALSIIATCDSTIAGYATLLLPAAPRPARLYTLAVDARQRGHGIATRVCEAVIDAARARGYDRLRLEVRTDNVAAQRLYERLGFTRIGRLPASYYADGGGGWRMQRVLTPPGSQR